MKTNGVNVALVTTPPDVSITFPGCMVERARNAKASFQEMKQLPYLEQTEDGRVIPHGVTITPEESQRRGQELFEAYEDLVEFVMSAKS